MELSVARSLAWGVEHGGGTLPAKVAEDVARVLAQGASVEVAPKTGHYIDVSAEAQDQR